MSDYGSRKPLYLQDPELNKALREGKKENPSYESARPNQILPVNYQEMEDRAGSGMHSRIRRYPNGQLDYDWLVAHIVNLVDELEFNKVLLPLDMAMLTVVFPAKFKMMEPQQAEIYTQLSKTEKARLSEMVEAKLKESLNWSGGAGGGSVPGRSVTLV
jgi:hypothetical protein